MFLGFKTRDAFTTIWIASVLSAFIMFVSRPVIPRKSGFGADGPCGMKYSLTYGFLLFISILAVGAAATLFMSKTLDKNRVPEEEPDMVSVLDVISGPENSIPISLAIGGLIGNAAVVIVMTIVILFSLKTYKVGDECRLDEMVSTLRFTTGVQFGLLIAIAGLMFGVPDYLGRVPFDKILEDNSNLWINPETLETDIGGIIGTTIRETAAEAEITISAEQQREIVENVLDSLG